MSEVGNLHLCLLSPWKAEFQGANLPIKGRKNRALVSYLALEAGRAIQRDELAKLLWPNGDSKKSRSSLRQSLSDLRKLSHNAWLSIDGTVITIERNVVSTDISRLLEELQNCTLGQNDLDTIRIVSELLSDLDGISTEYDEWLESTRCRLTCEVLAGAEQAIEQQKLTPEMQLRLSRTILASDDLNEIAIRGQIFSLAKLNDNTAAMRTYNAFYEKIEDELGVEPSLATQELAVRIKMETAPDIGAKTKTPATLILKERPLTMVAVLPFENLGPNKIPEYLILGMLDNITCKLAAFPAPAVISSNSTRQYLGQPQNVTEISQSLNVNYVLTGTFRSANNTAHLAVQLCDGRNGRVHWADTREIALQDIFEASLDLAENLVQAIEPSIDIAELERSRHLPNEELEPHHLVLNAKELMFRLNIKGFQSARQALEEALVIGPNFAPAHALLAEWHGINLWQGWTQDPQDTRMRLEEHSRRAIKLSPRNGRILAQWGHHKITLERDFDGALSMFEKAVELWPNDSETLFWTVPTLAHVGQGQQALGNGKKAFQLSPHDPFLHRNEHFLSLANYACGNFDEAAKLGLSSFQRAPNYGSNLRVTIASLVASGKISEAQGLAKHHEIAEPKFSLAKFQGKMGFKEPEAQSRYVERLSTAGIR